MFPYPNKYTQVSDKTPIKDIIRSIFSQGLYLVPLNTGTKTPRYPYSSINPIKDLNAALALLDKSEFDVAVYTGVYSDFEIVVIDIDNPEHNNAVLKLFPSCKTGNARSTAKGFHYTFKVPTGSNIKRTIKCNGLFDVITNGYVCWLGSVDKKPIRDIPITWLTPAEIELLPKSGQSTKSKNAHKTKVKATGVDESDYLRMFYAKEIKHGMGQSNVALCQVATARTNERAFQIRNKSYTLEQHILWMVSVAKNHLEKPDLVDVRQIARWSYGAFNFYIATSKITPVEYFNGYFPASSNISKDYIFMLQSILQNSFSVIPDELNALMNLPKGRKPKVATPVNPDMLQPMSLQAIKDHCSKLLVLAGHKPLVCGLDDLKLFLLQHHPSMMDHRVRTRMPNGKQMNISRWNLTTTAPPITTTALLITTTALLINNNNDVAPPITTTALLINNNNDVAPPIPDNGSSNGSSILISSSLGSLLPTAYCAYSLDNTVEQDKTELTMEEQWALMEQEKLDEAKSWSKRMKASLAS